MPQEVIIQIALFSQLKLVVNTKPIENINFPISCEKNKLHKLFHEAVLFQENVIKILIEGRVGVKLGANFTHLVE